ncbi:dihydropteroate synthase [Microbacterium sp. ZXX196]|uniref:dihydropteroate synthase n=1 Tax=Microbacterium sp. ZXX196 TaxID=2609291 RepID=UPI0013251E92|nr:dihydropteroate synthase [Microbacterium sp. ZXX196]
MIEIMGVVNVTPDSFSDGGEHFGVEQAVAHGARLAADGATILDVGGESTRPGSEPVGTEEELRRILPVVERLAAAGHVVSVDTYRADVARRAAAAGAGYINDVSGGLADAGMADAVAGTDAAFIVGHWRGPSADMYARAEYSDVAAEVAGELSQRVERALAAGVPERRILLDPGVGFAKAGPQNWRVLKGLGAVVELGFPVLVGTSRKRFLASALGEDASRARRDAATAVTSVLAQRAGAWGVRVHDAAATRDALAVLDEWDGA